MSRLAAVLLLLAGSLTVGSGVNAPAKRTPRAAHPFWPPGVAAPVPPTSRGFRSVPLVANRSRPLPRTARAQVRGVGFSDMGPTSRHLSTTAYCATGHRTASGLWPRVGMAAGPWPFGTRLQVERYGQVTIEDRIGWGSQLDIFMASCAEARQFGRRLLRVEVVR